MPPDNRPPDVSYWETNIKKVTPKNLDWWGGETSGNTGSRSSLKYFLRELKNMPVVYFRDLVCLFLPPPRLGDPDITLDTLEYGEVADETALEEFAGLTEQQTERRRSLVAIKAEFLLKVCSLIIPVIAALAMFAWKEGEPLQAEIYIPLSASALFSLLAVGACVRALRIGRLEGMYVFPVVDPKSSPPKLQLDRRWLPRWRLSCTAYNERIVDQHVEFIRFGLMNVWLTMLSFVFLIGILIFANPYQQDVAKEAERLRKEERAVIQKQLADIDNRINSKTEGVKEGISQAVESYKALRTEIKELEEALKVIQQRANNGHHPASPPNSPP